MGYSSFFAKCGCSGTRLMEPKEDIYIRWVKCAEHYTPEDDLKIIEAAKNKREHDKAIWDEVNKQWEKIGEQCGEENKAKGK